MVLRRLSWAIGGTMLALSVSLAEAQDVYKVRLSPGPRLVGTRAESSGEGTVSVNLSGNALTIEGSYRGLLGAPTAARLLMGPGPGVRGPKIADLKISSSLIGTISGSVKLTRNQFAAFRMGGLYIEIDSAEAPEGDLWGWLMPPAE
jgi:hypothetical protein